MSNETDRIPSSRTTPYGPSVPDRLTNLAATSATALVLTQLINGRVCAYIRPFGPGCAMRLAGSPQDAHQQVALQALERAGVKATNGLASAWKDSEVVAAHLVLDASPKRGRHDLPQPAARMMHSHLVTGRLLNGRVLAEGMTTAVVRDVRTSIGETFVDAAFQVVKASGMPIADLRTYVHENQAVSVFTTVPGTRRVESLESRIAKAYGRVDAAMTDGERDRYLLIARALEEHKEQEDEAQRFLASTRRRNA